jgi:hypothetical protein
MDHSRSRKALVFIPIIAALALFTTKAALGGGPGTAPDRKERVLRADLINPPTARTAPRSVTVNFDSLFGRSGELRIRLLDPSDYQNLPLISTLLGEDVQRPGIRRVATDDGEQSFAFATLTPWQRKLGAYIDTYHLGIWPNEGMRQVSSAAKSLPTGFIEVTPQNIDTPLSTHFKLRDFVTHDQQHIWPKYVVLREDLLDKLELVLAALAATGVPTDHVVVLSGFRSPQYNARGAGEGMARASRHQYGDAADLIVDADRDGRMDDLDRDGRVTFADLQVVDRAVQLIERKYPELVGGLGLYHEMGPSGPFAHIDVRGTRARWTNRQVAVSSTRRWVAAGPAAGETTGRCSAEGAMAVLCAGVR